MMEKVRRDLPADGELSETDAFESHPEFQDDLEDMSDEFFEKENPGYFNLLKRIKDAADKSTTKGD